MNETQYVHLHLHTEYSLLDGFTRIDRLFEKVKSMGMHAVAITDHGVMFGVVDFFKAANKMGIKAIIGCEVYVAPRSRFDKEASYDKNAGHLVLLVKNAKGYQNLIKLVSAGFVEGFYYKPRIDMALLEKHSEGLIALSACLAGDVQRLLLEGNLEGAYDMANHLKQIFDKGDFYLELQDHQIPEQKKVNRLLVSMSEKLDIPLVATNDVHYLNKEDESVHDILLCIQTGKVVNDRERMRFPTSEFYLKSPSEMAALFPHRPDALENSVKIAEKCNFNFDFKTTHLPEFSISSIAPDLYLRQLCTEGLSKKYIVDENHIKRLNYELDTIHKMGFDDYFLIVWDFIRFAKTNGIFVGPGRGSCGGSIVAYVLDITDVDPIAYDLIFERFLNPERITMPDIDIDFEDERRGEVIDYVVNKYGKDRVAQIATFGTMAARAAIRDVGRVLDVPYGDVDRIAKEIPFELGMTLQKAIDRNPKLSELMAQDSMTKKVIHAAMQLEGVPRHVSTHAAGVVISKNEIDTYVPLYLQEGNLSTQYNMTLLEELGLLKIDFLGLRTLTVIKNALKLIEETYGVQIELKKMPHDDAIVFDMLGKGDTLGLFQLESAGFRRFLRDLKPTVFEDIIAGISLYRPGPMDSIPVYIKNKHDKRKITYLHPLLKPILEVTYGCLVYQEQVMRIVRELAGYSYGRSDLVRRAMSKKKMDVMEEERKYFIYGKKNESGEIELEGCLSKGITVEIASAIFDDMVDFAKYAFNKSHAAGYAIIAYQTAYLKCHYPLAFMAALMTSVMGSHAKLAQYIQDSKDHGIQILPPSANCSLGTFSVEDGKIRYGLHAIKNVGKGIIDSIVKERNEKRFVSFSEFCERIDPSELNKRAVESLIKAGAFDDLGQFRSQLLAIYEKTVDGIHSQNRRRVEGQFSIFSMDIDMDAQFEAVPQIPELRSSILLQFEKEMLGIYLTGHPLDIYKKHLESIVTMNIAELKEVFKDKENPSLSDGETITLGGMVAGITEKVTRNGKHMAFIQLEDLYDVLEVIIFPNTYVLSRKQLIKDNVIVAKGRIQWKEDEEPKLIAETIKPLSDFKPQEQLQNKLYIRIKLKEDKSVLKVSEILNASQSNHEKASEVIFYIESTQEKFKFNNKVVLSKGVLDQLEELLGKDNVKMK